uniref:Parkin RBR E3 ubiquitin protein ligase n=1 Tax=Rousettus aegyptiacus TaxID=9407 RepID=A0A7J8KEU4_ROUAE|nr:parkin RBR E3 ubiquitin protein ligase [Rousettus aegyptiacus]
MHPSGLRSSYPGLQSGREGGRAGPVGSIFQRNHQEHHQALSPLPRASGEKRKRCWGVPESNVSRRVLHRTLVSGDAPWGTGAVTLPDKLAMGPYRAPLLENNRKASSREALAECSFVVLCKYQVLRFAPKSRRELRSPRSQCTSAD